MTNLLSTAVIGVVLIVGVVLGSPLLGQLQLAGAQDNATTTSGNATGINATSAYVP